MNVKISPAELDDLQRQLQIQLGGRIGKLRVVEREGHVVLQGIAISYYAKQLAQHLAFHALGRAALVNEIDVPAPELRRYSVEAGE